MSEERVDPTQTQRLLLKVEVHLFELQESLFFGKLCSIAVIALVWLEFLFY